MFYQIFYPLQMKQRAIISNKQGVYELPHELLNDLRVSILRYEEKSRKSQTFLEW